MVINFVIVLGNLIFLYGMWFDAVGTVNSMDMILCIANTPVYKQLIKLQ